MSFLLNREPVGRLREPQPYKFPLWVLLPVAIVAFALGFLAGAFM